MIEMPRRVNPAAQWVNEFTRSAAEGCTWQKTPGQNQPRCSSQQTATLDPINGRRCAAHSPIYGPDIPTPANTDG